MFPREDAMVITRMGDAAPLVMCCSEEILGQPDPNAGSEDLLAHVNEQIRRGEDIIPSPMLYASFPALRMAMGRDVGRDAENPIAALADIATRSIYLAQQYADFLDLVVRSAEERRIGVAIERLHRVTSKPQLESVLKAHPELLSAEVHMRLQAMLTSVSREEERHFVQGELEVLHAYGEGDTTGAWERYVAAAQGAVDININPELSRLLQAFEDAIGNGGKQAVEAGEHLLAFARYTKLENIEALTSLHMTTAVLQIQDDDRCDWIEQAIQLLERADTLFERHPDVGDEQDRRQTLANLAIALSERMRFDPVGNQERAIAIHRRLLSDVTIDTDGDLWAKAHTHLATNLLDRAIATTDHQKGEIATGLLLEILDHYHQALEWRSFERDPLDWAYTQMHLGRAHAEGGGNLDAAIEHYTNAVRGFEAAGEDMLRAQAIGDRASTRIALAQTDGIPPQAQANLLAVAEAETRAQLDVLSKGASHGVAHGAAWWQLARMLVLKDPMSTEAEMALRHTLRYWTPHTAPRHCHSAAHALALLAGRTGATSVAVDAWTTAAEAAAASVELRATREGRFVEIHATSNVFHSAACNLARVGQLRRAVEIIELGRARELAAWFERDLIDLDQLRHADPQLHERFVIQRERIETMQQRGLDPTDIDMAEAVEALAAIVEKIRRLPGFKEVLLRPRLSQLVASAPVGETVAYPVIGPEGSCWLVLRASAVEPVTSIDLPGLTSADVTTLFQRTDPAERKQAGYLTTHRDTDALDATIGEIGLVLGPGLLCPLAEHLNKEGIDEVCLVPLGLLGLLPLHALTWTDEHGQSRCLLDDLTVAYAPSAYARFMCRRRAVRRTETRKLVAVGNPLPHREPLEHAEREAHMIADSLAATETVLLLREAATKQAVLDALPGATHVHLACHGSAAFTPQALDAALSLANNQRLSAPEVLGLDLRTARLVVASACQSGVITDLWAADEALALSTVFIGAGAAAVIASLWSVSDYATALLMTRFYEYLAEASMQPVRALRAAQLWLRDLRYEEESAYVQRHPGLRDHQASHDAERTDRSDPISRTDGERRFAAPTLWAAFVFTGA